MQTLEERKQRTQNIARLIRPLLNLDRWDQAFLPLSPNRLKAIYKALKGLKHVLENVTSKGKQAPPLRWYLTFFSQPTPPKVKGIKPDKMLPVFSS
jgi:hypothetical protein